jgi:hypothetical protein
MINRGKSEKLDPFEVNGKESADRWAHNFKLSPRGIRGATECCEIVSEANSNLSNEAVQHFCKKIDMPATSVEFEILRMIGDRSQNPEESINCSKKGHPQNQKGPFSRNTDQHHRSTAAGTATNEGHQADLSHGKRFRGPFVSGS